jgi:hypothetical protein
MVTPYDKEIAVVNAFQMVRWSVENEEYIVKQKIKPKGPSVALSPDDKWLAVEAADKKIRLWGME